MESVGADVDLVDAAGDGLADVFFAAAAAAMQNQRHSQRFFQLGQTFKVQLRHIALRIIAVRCADRYRQSVAAGVFHKLLRFFDVGIQVDLTVVAVGSLADMTQLRFNADSVRMRQRADNGSPLDVFFIRIGRSVDHQTGEAVVDGRDHIFQLSAVIQV